MDYGGTLVATNVGGQTLQLGDSFKLFHAANYAGGFTNLGLPMLRAGLGWTNRLGVEGILAVANAVSLTPMPLSFTVMGFNLQLSWPAYHIGWRLESQTISRALGLGTNWATVLGSMTTNLVALRVNPANGAVF